MESGKLILEDSENILRLGENNDLIVVENIAKLPSGDVMFENHGLVVLCTEGRAQFDYDGQTFQLQKNDLFVFMMLRSVISNFMLSPDFNCRQLLFTRNEAWNINMYGKTGISDLVTLRQNPKVSLSEDEAALMDSYFLLLCRQMRNRETPLYKDIVRSLVGSLLLKTLSLLRHGDGRKNAAEESSPYGKQLAERFMQLVEQSDGRIRKVDDFASRLNVTPKYLSTLLKDTMNRRPSEVIQLFTMKAIEHRLRFTDMTMQQIAIDLNFANASFFGKYFKDRTGMSPLEFRRKYRRQ